MTKSTVLALAALIALSLPAAVSAGSFIAPAGYACTDTALDIPADGWFGGFDFLPNGNFVIFDGYTVREITRAGATVNTIYTYADPDPSTTEVEATFGSFVKYCGNRVYVGESTFGTVRSISLTDGADTLIATLPYNYDLDVWNGVPYAVSGNKIYRIDEAAGTADAIATIAGPSGPVAFDSTGNLIYGTGDYDWSTPNDQNIYLWSAAQVAGAGNGTVLGASDSTVIGPNVNGPGCFAFGPTGELLYTDSIGWPASIQALTAGVPQTFAETYIPDQSPWTTAIRSNSATGEIAAAVSWSEKINDRWITSSVISTLAPVPEPSSVVSLCSLIGLAASFRLLRRGR